MKKIKVNNNLEEIIEAAKCAGFKYTFSPSVNVIYVIVDKVKRLIRFEYGGDVYDFEEVDLGFFGDMQAPKTDYHYHFENGHVAFNCEPSPEVLEVIAKMVEIANDNVEVLMKSKCTCFKYTGQSVEGLCNSCKKPGK